MKFWPVSSLSPCFYYNDLTRFSVELRIWPAILSLFEYCSSSNQRTHAHKKHVINQKQRAQSISFSTNLFCCKPFLTAIYVFGAIYFIALTEKLCEPTIDARLTITQR